MVDTVRVANEKRKRCEEYTDIDMTVHSLAVWHSYLGHHARWVLGVRHDKERSVRKRKRKLCSQDGCTIIVKQGGVCLKHGARVKLCSQDGCDRHVQQGGVCVKHGGLSYRARAF
jgi:hypothetical protein